MDATFFILTYGCQMNKCDSEAAEGLLLREGLRRASRPEEADLVILNTCSVRSSAEERAMGVLGGLARLGRSRSGVAIGVMGCMAQKEGERLLERVPHLSFVLGTRRVARLPEAARRALSGERFCDLAEEGEEPDFTARPVEGPCAFVTVMRGCESFCSYCVVPYLRGPERSRPEEDVLREVACLVERGVKEVTLLGQNVLAYRGRDGSDFVGLLRRVAQVPGLVRLRFLTSHPKDVTDELFEAIATLPVVCESLHLPVQAGSNRVLAAMGRGYTRERYLELVEKARQTVPGLHLSTDVICGFPGEADEEFEETVDLFERVRFDSAFVYKYSRRDGTPAAALPGELPETVVRERHARLLALQERISGERNAALVGQRVEVLAEKVSRREGYLVGRTRGGVRVTFPAGGTRVGDLVWVTVEGASAYALSGRRSEG